MARPENLNSMSIDKLRELRSEVESTLASKVVDERHSIEMRLSELSRIGSQDMRAKGRRAGGKVAPKYRNPENPSETWAGRGLRPRWLTAALKAGKKLEQFSVDSAGKRGPKMVRKTKGKASRKVAMKKARSPRVPAISAATTGPA
jgi:DNA-binding protein H-NS